MSKVTIHGIDWEVEEFQKHIEEVIESVHYSFTRMNDARSLTEQAEHLSTLNDRIFDLTSWHRGFEYQSGTMPWEREDEV